MPILFNQPKRVKEINIMDHKVGIIPFDVKEGNIAVLFVTSIGRGRWILPKCDLELKESHKEGCLRCAFDEAGVKGSLLDQIPMTNVITKSDFGATKNIAVTYYPMLVEEQLDEWPEFKKRQRHWALLDSADRVTDREDFLRVINLFASLKPFILEHVRRKKV